MMKRWIKNLVLVALIILNIFLVFKIWMLNFSETYFSSAPEGLFKHVTLPIANFFSQNDQAAEEISLLPRKGYQS